MLIRRGLGVCACVWGGGVGWGGAWSWGGGGGAGCALLCDQTHFLSSRWNIPAVWRAALLRRDDEASAPASPRFRLLHGSRLPAISRHIKHAVTTNTYNTVAANVISITGSQHCWHLITHEWVRYQPRVLYDAWHSRSRTPAISPAQRRRSGRSLKTLRGCGAGSRNAAATGDIYGREDSDC